MVAPWIVFVVVVVVGVVLAVVEVAVEVAVDVTVELEVEEDVEVETDEFKDATTLDIAGDAPAVVPTVPVPVLLIREFIFARVCGPTLPTAGNPYLVWNAFTACWVSGPK